MIAIEKLRKLLFILTFMLSFMNMYSTENQRTTDDRTENEIFCRTVLANENSVSINYRIKDDSIIRNSIFDTLFDTLKRSGYDSISCKNSFRKSELIIVPSEKVAQVSLKHCRFAKVPADNDNKANLISNNDSFEYGFTSDIPIHDFLSLGEMEYYRGIKLQTLNVSPIYYDNEHREFMILYDMTYDINFIDTGNDEVVESSLSVFSNDKFLKNAVNFANSAVKPRTMVSNQSKEFLVITTTELEQEVCRFDEWKRKTGFKTSVVAQEVWTSEEIAKYVSAFANTHPNFMYLLLVGDHQNVPPKYMDTKIGDSSYITDYGYGCLDGEYDMLADVYMGRIPVLDSATAKIVFDKIIRYERYPPIDEVYYENAIIASKFETDPDSGPTQASNSFIRCSETVRDIIMANSKSVERIYNISRGADPREFDDGTELPEDLLNPDFIWGKECSDIINSINRGTHFVMYRGHGSSNGWVGASFDSDDVLYLENRSFPVIFSICCNTGQFYQDNCLANSFLMHENGGAVGVIAAGSYISRNNDNALAVGIAKESYQYANESSELMGMELGSILKKALIYESSQCGDRYDSKATRFLYHCFGDPSMQFYTDIPYCGYDMDFKNGSVIKVACNSDESIMAINKDTGAILTFRGSAVIPNLNGRNISVCISKEGKRPLVFDSYDKDYIILDNGIYTSNLNLTSNQIEVGNNNGVYGDSDSEVIFSSGANIILAGETVLNPGVRVDKGAGLEIVGTSESGN